MRLAQGSTPVTAIRRRGQRTGVHSGGWAKCPAARSACRRWCLSEMMRGRIVLSACPGFILNTHGVKQMALAEICLSGVLHKGPWGEAGGIITGQST